MKYMVMLVSALVSLFSSAAWSADDPPVTIAIQRLSLDMAVKAAQATVEACREKGMNITVAVVDRGGRDQVVLRDTLAMPLTVDVARQKAYAAMNFNVPTSQLENRFTAPFSPGKVEGIVLSAGAVPIEAGGTIIGGIGVSGAPSGKTDEECASAGLAAISTDLEMSI